MSFPFLVHRNNNLFSVVNATAIICTNAPRPVAVAAIVEAFGLSADDASAALDIEADAGEYRATFLSASAAELQSLSEALDGKVEPEVIEELRHFLDMIYENQQMLRDEIAADRQLQFQQERPARLAAEYERRRKEFAANGVVLTKYELELLRKIVDEDVK